MELSLDDMRELLCADKQFPSLKTGTEDHGYCIAVLDNGFVYLGDVKTDGGYIYITNAKNVRRWTGNHGLSWYATNGFSKDITLDASGDVKAPRSEIKHLIACTTRA